MPLAMIREAASVKWIPSQLINVDGSTQTVDPGAPHRADPLKLYRPPCPQQAECTLVNPASQTNQLVVIRSIIEKEETRGGRKRRS